MPAVPKPSRSLRLTIKAGERIQRRADLEKLSKRRRAKSYGGSDWPAFKARILARDGHRCIFRCATERLGITVHHWYRGVGAGGRNEDTNACVLCASCHDLAHRFVATWRAQIWNRLLAMHGPSAVPQQWENA